MLTSKEAKNNANNHSLQACQSGTWRKVGSGELQIATAQATGWRFLGQQLLVQLENVLQVAAEYAPHELVTYGLPGHSHQPITHGQMRAIQTKIRMVQ
ncbi:hypothetical protein ABNU49_24635 [Citrobacter koseri]|uniref:hypothetical protein n=1 Tax=Citrobacter koseri TaxID=545 RepID=UPI00339C80BE